MSNNHGQKRTQTSRDTGSNESSQSSHDSGSEEDGTQETGGDVKLSLNVVRDPGEVGERRTHGIDGKEKTEGGDDLLRLGRNVGQQLGKSSSPLDVVSHLGLFLSSILLVIGKKRFSFVSRSLDLDRQEKRSNELDETNHSISEEDSLVSLKFGEMVPLLSQLNGPTSNKSSQSSSKRSQKSVPGKNVRSSLQSSQLGKSGLLNGSERSYFSSRGRDNSANGSQKQQVVVGLVEKDETGQSHESSSDKKHILSAKTVSISSQEQRQTDVSSESQGHEQTGLVLRKAVGVKELGENDGNLAKRHESEKPHPNQTMHVPGRLEHGRQAQSVSDVFENGHCYLELEERASKLTIYITPRTSRRLAQLSALELHVQTLNVPWVGLHWLAVNLFASLVSTSLVSTSFARFCSTVPAKRGGQRRLLNVETGYFRGFGGVETSPLTRQVQP